MAKSCDILAQKKCIPCEGGVPALGQERIEQLLSELGHGWVINDKGHLTKEYKFKNFVQSMNFANQITNIAEAEGHHPDLHISWGKCVVEIWTHKINGLTESDFYLAAKIEKLVLL